MRTRWRLVAMALLVLVAGGAAAQGAGGGPNPADGCPFDGGMAGELTSKVCYGCFFPIQVAGQPTDNKTPVMAMATGPTCFCPSVFFGYPTWGVTYGQWLPLRMVETVRKPYCSAIAGQLGGGDDGGGGDGGGGDNGFVSRLMGGFIGDVENQGEKEGYYHFHWFGFPLGMMADMNVSQVCKDNSGTDMDLLYLSELDPTWNNDELAITLTPEAALFANDVALLACLADSVAASVYQPIDPLFWCAGAWGEMYPHTGHTPHDGSPPQMHSLVATRAIAAMHRRGLSMQMMGPTAVCANHPNPIIPKSQYRFQTVYPVAEENFNHVIGANPFVWGEWRNIPGVGEDWVSIIWAYEQCCVND